MWDTSERDRDADVGHEQSVGHEQMDVGHEQKISSLPHTGGGQGLPLVVRDTVISLSHRCRATMAHVRQERQDSGMSLEVKVFRT